MENLELQSLLDLRKELEVKVEILDKEFELFVRVSDTGEHIPLQTFKQKATELSDLKEELDSVSQKIKSEIDSRRLESFRLTIANNSLSRKKHVESCLKARRKRKESKKK